MTRLSACPGGPGRGRGEESGLRRRLDVQGRLRLFPVAQQSEDGAAVADPRRVAAQPLQILRIGSCDLAQRPAGVSAEVDRQLAQALAMEARRQALGERPGRQARGRIVRMAIAIPVPVVSRVLPRPCPRPASIEGTALGRVRKHGVGELQLGQPDLIGFFEIFLGAHALGKDAVGSRDDVRIRLGIHFQESCSSRSRTPDIPVEKPYPPWQRRRAWRIGIVPPMLETSKQ